MGQHKVCVLLYLAFVYTIVCLPAMASQKHVDSNQRVGFTQDLIAAQQQITGTKWADNHSNDVSPLTTFKYWDWKRKVVSQITSYAKSLAAVGPQYNVTQSGNQVQNNWQLPEDAPSASIEVYPEFEGPADGFLGDLCKAACDAGVGLCNGECNSVTGGAGTSVCFAACTAAGSVCKGQCPGHIYGRNFE